MSRLRSALSTPAASMDPQRFEAAVRRHEAFAAGRPGGNRALLRYAVAHNMNCNRRMLSDADFTGADLSGSSFVGADLRRVTFYCANLSKTEMRGAQLARADLRGATFAGARLCGANLDDADMRAAILYAADDVMGLRWVGGRAESTGGRATAEGVSHGVDMSNCTLRRARMAGANLKNVNMSGANLEGADLAGAKLEGANLSGAVLTGVDLDSLKQAGIDLSDCVTDPSAEAHAALPYIETELAGAEDWVSSNGRQGRPATIDDHDLRPAAARFRERLLVGLRARRVVAIGIDFSRTQLQGAVFDNADLRNADFTGADLRGASFRNARLSHAIFRDANLNALQLSDGRGRAPCFEGAVMDGTGLAIVAAGAAG